ncbi:MAG: thiamine phosphate synthase, partial [Pseudomonadota bacterium]
MKRLFDIYVITDRRLVPGGDLVEFLRVHVAGLAEANAAVQLREKDLFTRELWRLYESVERVLRGAGVPLLVNDRLDVALAAGADGVHLPQAGIPVEAARKMLPAEMLLGVSTHNMAELAEAQAGGADFITFGPVYDTASKRQYGPPVGETALAEATKGGVPVFALGGVKPKHTRNLVALGARGIACISAVLAASDPGAALRAFAG